MDYEEKFRSQVSSSKVGKNKEIKDALSLRRAVTDAERWKRQPGSQKIWLISDRYKVADDNGGAFFRYKCSFEHPDIKVYFVIDKDSPDFERLSEIGNVVAQDSREHRVLHMLADCIVSSQADEYIWDPLWREGQARQLFKDYYARQKFVFLQHGVIKDDLSRWLNRRNKNIDGFYLHAGELSDLVSDCLV